MKKYYKIGKYKPRRRGKEAVIERGAIEQGWVYKDERAFYKRFRKVCYIPELDDEPYTREDFLLLCNGSVSMAEYIFYAVDWQSPESLIDEMIQQGEWEECERCTRFYCPHNPPKTCEGCGAEIITEA